jgi:hypothetical protein
MEMLIMDINTIWSAGLSIVMGILSFVIKEKFNDIRRIEVLLNRTREELARDYTTNVEVQRITDHIDQRFNRLEAKIDQLIRGDR